MNTKRKADEMAAAASGTTNDDITAVNGTGASASSSSSEPQVKNHDEMMAACASGELAAVLALLEGADTKEEGKQRNNDSNNSNLSQSHLLAATQDPTTGKSPLMVASQHGHMDICAALLGAGAPWNAVDRYGKCAGDYATDAQKWEVVNLLVEAGTKAELILGASIRLAKQLNCSSSNNENSSTDGGKENGSGKEGQPKDDKNDDVDQQKKSDKESTSTTTIPVSHEPCTKPDYLSHNNVRYNAANTLLLDNDDDAVMMEWERPLMNAHASILTSNGTAGKRVLNIGFGLGIIDTSLQSYEPSLHVIIEAHPTVYKKMLEDGWDKKEGVRICFGRWQDELPKLLEEGVMFDGIFYDTYGEHFTDLEDFHDLMAKCLSKPDGIYSFFNGLAPDNLFFHGIACNCVKIQLEHLGLETEFAQCEIQVNEKDWEGVRRKYWHGRDTYYLPIATWKKKEEKNSE